MEDHTAYAEWGETSRDALSAEGVALSLISKFSDKHLPKASDLLWLVSEQDVAQQLLPMPGSWVVNPDENHFTFLRGTRDWAPPRAQIIFTKHLKREYAIFSIYIFNFSCFINSYFLILLFQS